MDCYNIPQGVVQRKEEKVWRSEFWQQGAPSVPSA